MPVHPDPDKETILLRYPEDGSVKAVSNLIQDNKGNQEIVTTDPTTKNQPAFYQKRDSLFIANFFKNMRAQMQDPAKMPELYIVSFDKVGAVAADLRKLHEDPKNEVLLETAKKYRTYTQNLEKIIFDVCPRQNWRQQGSMSNRWSRTVFSRRWNWVKSRRNSILSNPN